eukprot:748210-Hanusia_phi.AAC.5
MGNTCIQYAGQLSTGLSSQVTVRPDRPLGQAICCSNTVRPAELPEDSPECAPTTLVVHFLPSFPLLVAELRVELIFQCQA